jgi:hypothetical protein
MTDLQKELLDAIEEIVLETNMSIKEVIKQAIELLREVKWNENMGND